MTRSEVPVVYVVCVALAITLVLAGWIWNVRSLFAQTQVEREGGMWDRIFNTHVPRVTQDVRKGSADMKEMLTPVLQEAQEQSRRQQAYDAAIKDMKEVIPTYVETGTQKTDTR